MIDLGGGFVLWARHIIAGVGGLRFDREHNMMPLPDAKNLCKDIVKGARSVGARSEQ
jgi:hypothetical protein